jgi:hypothetical protein
MGPQCNKIHLAMTRQPAQNKEICFLYFQSVESASMTRTKWKLAVDNSGGSLSCHPNILLSPPPINKKSDDVTLHISNPTRPSPAPLFPTPFRHSVVKWSITYSLCFLLWEGSDWHWGRFIWRVAEAEHVTQSHPYNALSQTSPAITLIRLDSSSYVKVQLRIENTTSSLFEFKGTWHLCLTLRLTVIVDFAHHPEY